MISACWKIDGRAPVFRDEKRDSSLSASAGTPHRGRDRAADDGRPPGRPLWSPRCNGDHGRLPPRAALERAGRPAMDQIDFVQKMIRINRVKNGTGSMHYLGNSE